MKETNHPVVKETATIGVELEINFIRYAGVRVLLASATASGVINGGGLDDFSWRNVF